MPVWEGNTAPAQWLNASPCVDVEREKGDGFGVFGFVQIRLR